MGTLDLQGSSLSPKTTFPFWKVFFLVTDAGRDWGEKEKRTTEDEMAGWQHRQDGREFE